MRIRPIAGALGAEIEGVDLRALGDAGLADIRRAWLDNLVVFFRGQTLSPQELLAFAGRLGEITEYPLLKGLSDAPQVVAVVKREHETINFGGVWHSDTTYLPKPPMATLLIAREIPPQGGDTVFANMYLAYETLSDGMRRLIEPLTAISSSAKADASRTREERLRENGAPEAAGEFLAEHPVVRVHPETGRRALFVNPAHTVRFGGMTQEESAPLLDYLFRHQVRAEFTCRFAWSVGALALWDNRCTLHYPINDYHGYARLMHRVTLAGDVPSGVGAA
ncbi:MAG: TauD/TfdA family dioxygenase [Proteobacteria bacterium]|nr:TauD/TfdA family dioxygenase [Pseudomonadota bacterium]